MHLLTSKPPKGWGFSILNMQHFCSYSPLRKTIRDRANGKTWIERCRCGRLKVVDCSFFIEDSKSPKITVSWYNANGEQERINNET